MRTHFKNAKNITHEENNKTVKQPSPGSKKSPPSHLKYIEEVELIFSSQRVHGLVNRFYPDLATDLKFFALLTDYINNEGEEFHEELVSYLEARFDSREIQFEIFTTSLMGLKDILQKENIRSTRSLDRYLLVKREKIAHKALNESSGSLFFINEEKESPTAKT